MIQILGLRDYQDRNSGRIKKTQMFFEKGWGVKDIDDIFTQPLKYLDVIPEQERENLYFTVADCFEVGEARKLREQWVIPFDIDHLSIENPTQEAITKHCLEILKIACTVLKVDMDKVPCVFSGNGMQFFVKMDKPIMDNEYFDTMKEYYGVLAGKIQAELSRNRIAGDVDTSVFSAARLMRLPETWNIKPQQGKKWAFIVKGGIAPQHFNLTELVVSSEIRTADTMSKEVWKRNLNTPDTQAILSECEFIKWAGEEQDKVSEEQWYAMLGTTVFLPDGESISHKYSNQYKGYSHDETQDKIEQTLRASGPRSCKDISKRWDGCKKCAHYNKITHPILIRGRNYIATKDTGFRLATYDAKGLPKPGKIAYEDLIKQFLLEHGYAKIAGNGMYVYMPDEKKWVNRNQDHIKEWMRNKITAGDKPSGQEMMELLSRLSSVNVRPKEWLDSPVGRYINFSNGVLDRQEMVLLPHDKEYGFKYVLPFDYNPYAKAPRFEKFLEEICSGDMGKVQLLKEFGGYCLSGDVYAKGFQYALILVGDGSNGKSVFMDTLKQVAGRTNVSSVPIKDAHKPTTAYNLVNKLFNCTEEANNHAFANNDFIKQLVGGGDIMVKALYEQEFSYTNNAKIIIACNSLPYNYDGTYGMMRRLLVVRFDRTFKGNEIDRGIHDKLAAEASGIYNVLLNAYAEAKRKNSFTIPQSVEDAIAEYKQESDIEIAFLLETLVEDASSEVRTSDIYARYSSYCAENGVRNVKNKIHFMRRVKSAFAHSHVKAARVKGKVEKIVHGIRFIDEDDI